MKKLIIILSCIYFLLFGSNAFAKRYPSLDDSIWIMRIDGYKPWDYTLYKNGTCKIGHHDIWYSEWTDCRWSHSNGWSHNNKVMIYADEGWPNGRSVVEGQLTRVESYDGKSYHWEIRGKRTWTRNNAFYPFNIEAKYIDKWIEVELPKPKIEPKLESKVSEKNTPQTNTQTKNYQANEPLRGREKAKELFSDKFDSAIKAALGAAFGVLAFFGIDSATGGRIEKKFNLKIAYAIAAFIGWMLTKFI